MDRIKIILASIFITCSIFYFGFNRAGISSSKKVKQIIEVNSPKYSNQTSLNIIQNDFELVNLKNKFSKLNQFQVIKVLHIGDSHVKSGMLTEPFIQKLNDHYAVQLKRNIFINCQIFSKSGTKYSDYSELDELDTQLQKEKFDLVIISLGTNDAFSGSWQRNFYLKIDRLIKKITRFNKATEIILTTPADALRKNVTTMQFEVLPEIEFVVNSLIRYSIDNKLAYWDLYHIMGGPYTVNKWFIQKLAAPDRIHYTQKGYLKIADLFSQAFIKSIK